MMVLAETRERLLLAIAKEIPIEQIAEIHFFQPIKQGGIESGVAVVAAQQGGPPTVEHRDGEAGAVGPSHDPRFTVYTALYRLNLKGMDRGKWEVAIVPEADAPLDAVDAVVRGVQRRSGDLDAAERMSGDEVRELLGGGRPPARSVPDSGSPAHE